MKRVLFAIAAILAVGVVTAVSVAAVSRSADSVTTLRLVEREQSFHFVDVPPSAGPNTPPSAGDSFVFTSTLWTRGGKRAGTLRASCVSTSGGENGTLTCYGTFGLKGGQLAAMATLRGESRTTHIAIVGGTGAYAGARGEAVSVERNGGENAPSDDVFRFTTS
jgi:hypothetical protein